ncbi:acyl-CoA dehydrogenase family protein [Salicibibacter cibarius]|uniref:Acyl-[acyl-carrier-protein] dehydrogenase MbtN n=1 Tax=Salicibibacter cibarius TaxID=2743000 RepID=A0A7T6Z401_9BACI|nr:acyl-CoA dehydrogenase family protein [Salicibibacter cibarius]QQK76435.1 acyl-CoA dehydrogenase family protein [Salicibibacter cibarius]
MGLSVYTDEHQIFRESLRRFLEKEVVPNLEEWDKEKSVPKEMWKKFGEHGFLCPWVDEKYGGAGVGFEYSVISIEEMAKIGFDMATSLHSDIVAPYIASHGTEEQKEKWLPKCVSGELPLAIGMTEPNTGSDLASIQTTAKKSGNDYIINGQKVFITNGMNCGMVLVACKTDTKADPPHKGISLIAVEDGTPGFIKAKKLDKLGRNTSEVAELFFEDCRVPVGNLIGEEGKGFQYMMEKLQQERLIQIIRSQTDAETMLEMTIDYCQTRTAFGKPISKFQHNQFKITEMATEIELGRTLLDQLLEGHLKGEEDIKRVSMAKWWITEMANRVAYHCLQLHGGNGYMEEYSIARRYRNVRMDTIAAGTTEIMKLIIARQMKL